MHIEDWNDKFLSEFDPEDYCDNLKRAKIQCAMIYLQSHVGLCNFPTKVCREHKAFCGNGKMKALIDGCKKNNINVVAYYSLIHNNWAEINHPDWKMIEKTGNRHAKTEEDTVSYARITENIGNFLKNRSKKWLLFPNTTACFTICRSGRRCAAATLVKHAGKKKWAGIYQTEKIRGARNGALT